MDSETGDSSQRAAAMGKIVGSVEIFNWSVQSRPVDNWELKSLHSSVGPERYRQRAGKDIGTGL